MNKRPDKSRHDDALDENRIGKEIPLRTLKQAVASQLVAAMKNEEVSKARLAILMRTSRTQVDRLLDPESDVTLSSLLRAAAVVGRQVNVELV